ncbi:hypothetical protein TSOC_008483 [Tetrabaena socialis]|uniref:Uncharacterized protein n=1 Tax=Tetrabaena socialis TaxID=47790 RepID=A0A2J7ZYD2_9CHLO|nr:hypothetical protein TSOC_008483 [Tetrabaena socialis]|eukprot:PNH05268.1 hypothetical protein TSOC_008483 [Tetrabaena socialis]
MARCRTPSSCGQGTTGVAGKAQVRAPCFVHPRLADLHCQFPCEASMTIAHGFQGLLRRPRATGQPELHPAAHSLSTPRYCVICCHTPSIDSFHSVTALLPSDTARMEPVVDQLTRQTGTLKSCTSRLSQPPLGSSPYTNTCPSCPADAMVFLGRPRLGAHATSRTQSLCPGSESPSRHPRSLCVHTCGRPEVTNRFTGPAGCCLLVTSEPGACAGAQLTAVHPTLCPPGS